MESSEYQIRTKVTFHFSNAYWHGLVRLEMAKNIIKSSIPDDEKQNKLAKLFGPESWELVVDQ